MGREAREVFFVDGVRTPFGKAGPKGQYWRTRADDLGVKAVRELLRRNPQIPVERIGDVAFAATAQVGDQGLTLGRDVALLAGLPESALDRVVRSVPLMDGAERLITTLRTLGYKTAILSGGFTFVGEDLQRRLGIDYLRANELDVRGGVVTGRVREPIVDGQRKAQYLSEIARAEGLNMEQVIAVGDGANDLPMLGLAGLGIAFRAKPVVRRSARQSLSTIGLDGILYLIGVRDREAMTAADVPGQGPVPEVDRHARTS
jgi:phosphoserine phosphatase